MEVKKFSLDFILKASGGNLLKKGRKSFFDGISTDSRKIKNSEAFAALKGDNFDGHNFIADVIDKGIKCIIISSNDCKIEEKKQVWVIKVEDTLKALGDIASSYRKLINPLVIGITGSSGKTTTKEMIAAVLKQKYSLLKTEGNLNNLIGLPMTILRLRNEDIALLEMGTNAFGEIKKLSFIAQPDIAVITNVGEAHLEGFGSLEGVAREKKEIFKGLKKDGKAVINSDDPYIVKIAKKLEVKKITFGLKNSADVSAENLSELGIKGEKFILKTPEGRIPVHIKIQGKHNLYNALAASAVGSLLGISLDDIKKALEQYKPYSMRFEVVRLKNKAYLVNDCYNANPSSMRAALETVSSMAGAYRKLAILGDMKELGAASRNAHETIGRLTAQLNFGKLFLFGSEAKYIADGALSKNFNKKDIFLSSDKFEIFKKVKFELKENDWILVKGSRGMKLEEIASMLRKDI